ncbi:hypothetical protein PTTG_26156 [Puccinia triticina 1-1 BBBD Race 1]|uniref:G-protein coupled receptors family 1 profile domain-containing protein n=2 Tax=Puccinia triticina TaxID=208348 RepID=A0A180GX85_PUCT1|nr:uncharacterized protein PtA15_6A752 [Puccinia triticina]OAV97144.1 hypothetical protein PTTG_26156 [Puccinia triticina 1-1 BBBD Race 1]WAQ86122.1 hypothetical protein PtA15_6A752 [Puccinia triticina]WAR56008.1 hypothetical protein PtB15_6B752 [Puccinia triticina]
MSVPLSSYQPPPSHLTVDRHGLLIVAGAASISLFATLFLLLYVTVLSIVSKKPGCTWASPRLVFMQTSFGPIFLNLVFADMLLAIGLMHNFINSNERGAVTASITCTSQGVLIQLADVASALLNLLIAIETFIILSNGPMLSCLELHSFYNWNGAWCWISPDYLTYQITFHNVWIWLAATGLVALYGTLFSRIRTHYKGEGHILRRSSIVIPAPSTPSTISSMSGSQNHLSKAAKGQRVGSKGLRVVARTMLVYPISFVAYSIPLTVISLIENHRHATLSPVLALVLSTLFALRGAIDVLAFGMTRNVFILRTPPTPAYDEEQLTPTSPNSIHKPRQISLDLDKMNDLKESSTDLGDSQRFHPTVDVKFSHR